MTITSTARELMRLADPLPESLSVDTASTLTRLLEELTEAVEPDFVAGRNAPPPARRGGFAWLAAAAVLATLAVALGATLTTGEHARPPAARQTSDTATAPPASTHLDCAGLAEQECASMRAMQEAELRAHAAWCQAGATNALQLAINKYAVAHNDAAALNALDAANDGFLTTQKLQTLWHRYRDLLTSSGSAKTASGQIAAECGG